MPKFCKYCGDPITEGELFCDNCGKRIEGETPPPHPVCARCGAELNPASKFCRSCGAPVSGTPSPRPAAGRTPPPPPVARRPPPLPRATTPSGPPPAPAPAPIPSAPAAPPEKRRKKGCCGCVFGFVSVVLVVLGVAALGIMAFYHPGFLLKDKEESLETILERMASEGSIESFLNTDFAITKETSPGNPRLIKTTWSELDVKGSEVFTADVAPDAGSVSIETSAGMVGVDFASLYPEEKEDALIVRILPELHDANSGMTLHGYDFSLESGRHAFTTRNRITIPRHSPANKDGRVYYYNPDTQEYEFVHYEVSEDRKSYYAYLDHFSIVVEGIPEYYLPSKSTGNLYHEPEADRVWPLMARSVAVNDADLEKWMKGADIDFGLMSQEGMKEKDAWAMGIDAASGIDLSLEIWKAGKNAKNLLSGIAVVVEKTSLFGWDGVVFNLGNGIIAAQVGLAMIQNPSLETFSSTFKEDNWQLAWDLGMSAAVNGGKYLAGAAVFPGTAVPVSAALIAVSMTYGSYGVFKMVLQYLGKPPPVNNWRERAYQRYLLEEMAYVLLDGREVAVSLARRDPTKKERASMGQEEIENCWSRDRMYLAVRNILVAHPKDSKAIQERFDKLREGYLEYFWKKLPLAERRDYSVPAELRDTYVDPSPGDVEAMISYHRKWIDNCITDRVRAVLKDDVCAKQEELKKVLADKVLPALNDRIYFFVKDSDLPEGTHFDQSPYSAYHKNREIKDYGRYMWFLDAKGKPVETGSYGEYAFYPNNADKSDYGEESIQPYPRENSDFVFHCSRYHFMQMGAPGWLVLHGRLDWPEVRIPIEIPPLDGSGTTRVELVIPKQSLQDALQKFAGIWRPLGDLEKRGLPANWVSAVIYYPKHNVFCEYEGRETGKSSPGMWTEIRKFDYDKKTGILTIDYRLNNPDGGTGIATYRINHEGRLLMHNEETGEDSVWIREATQSVLPKMEKDMDDFLKEVREAAAKKPTDNKPRSTSGVVVNGVIRIGNE